MLSLDAELAESKAHEARVAAFLASVPKRKRERVLARYTVLEERQLRRIRRRSHCTDCARRMPPCCSKRASMSRP